MKKRSLPPALLAACLLLCGCSSLLERSYSVVEPYTDRYWDTSAEDTLRAESYQDLVNSLLMLVEQRIEEGAIRCYGDVNSYPQALAAQDEVRNETALGSYLLEDLSFDYESGSAYSTLTYRMTYREGTEDIGTIMTLSDSQSLVDLLRLHVREDHEKLTAQFVYDTPRSDVTAAVESFWQELCAGDASEEAPAEAPALETPEEERQDGAVTGSPAEGDSPDAGQEEIAPVQEAGPEADALEAPPPSEEDGAVSALGILPETAPEETPLPPAPCPWTVRFFPDKETAAIMIVEILLR